MSLGELASAGRRVRVAGLEAPSVLLLAILVLGWAAFTTPEFDPDFWWHARVGLEILAHGVPQHNYFTFTAFTRPFITQEWGAEAIYALLYTHLGMTAVILLMAGVTWAGFLLAVRRVWRLGRSAWAVSLGAALVVISGLQIWGPSPQMFTFGLLGVLLTFLDRYRSRPAPRLLLLLVPLFALWSNLHGGFTIGLGVMAVFLAGEGLATALRRPEAMGWRPLRDLLAGLVLAALSAMVNPNGLGVYLYPLKLLLSHVAQANLNEWQPPDFHQAANIPALFLLLSLVVVARWARRTRISDLFLAVAGVLLLLYAVRDIPIFAVLSLPLWVDGVEQLGLELRAGLRLRPRCRAPAPVWFTTLVLALVVLTTAARMMSQLGSPENQLQSSAYPVAVGRVICDGPTARVLAPYGSSGWLLYRIDRAEPAGRGCAPDRVFIFGEAVLMGRQIISDYLQIVAGGQGSLSLLNSYRVNLVWQPRGSALAVLLSHTSGWTCVFGTSANLLYAPTSSASGWHASRAGCPAGG